MHTLQEERAVLLKTLSLVKHGRLFGSGAASAPCLLAVKLWKYYLWVWTYRTTQSSSHPQICFLRYLPGIGASGSGKGCCNPNPPPALELDHKHSLPGPVALPGGCCQKCPDCKCFRSERSFDELVRTMRS